MAAITTFESQLQSGSSLEELWNEVRPHFFDGKVTSREDAYVLFSRVLKITQATRNLDCVRELWLKTLAVGTFSLCVKGEASQEYHFHTIIDLIKSGTQHFEVDIEVVNPSASNLIDIAQTVRSICSSALGNPPSLDFFLQKLESPKTLCLLGKHKENDIACLYGTLFPFPRGHIFHLTFLGRKIEYPSIRILEKFNGQVSRILQRFPQIDYFTLCVGAENGRMVESCEKLGLQKLDFIEKGPEETPIYFYGKKTNAHSDVAPPSYEEFNQARQRALLENASL